MVRQCEKESSAVNCKACYSPLTFTTHKRRKKKDGTWGDNKLNGFMSLNCSVCNSEFCKLMSSVDGTICQDGYCHRLYPNAESAYFRNQQIMTGNDFQPEFVPAQLLRLHSFGEIQSLTHAKNIMKLIRFNPHCQFTLWSKRSKLVYDAMGGDKPSNLILIYSSYVVNKQAVKPRMFDKVFTVYSKEYIEKNKVEINCGAKSCMKCMKCYNKNDDTVFITEEKK